MSFQGRRVLALESRRSTEIAELIRKQGGEPFVAPSMREAPIAGDDTALQFAARLAAGEFEMVMLLTGVGARQLHRIAGEPFVEGLRRVTIAARGPKPVAALREMGLKADIVAPEPNTWRELLAATEGRPERKIALQEYGRPNPDLV
jgi:uroporphyrinogen-III synthase